MQIEGSVICHCRVITSGVKYIFNGEIMSIKNVFWKEMHVYSFLKTWFCLYILITAGACSIWKQCVSSFYNGQMFPSNAKRVHAVVKWDKASSVSARGHSECPSSARSKQSCSELADRLTQSIAACSTAFNLNFLTTLKESKKYAEFLSFKISSTVSLSPTRALSLLALSLVFW